jgi:hypothetical protein
MDERNFPNPADWQTLWPDHFAEIATASAELLSAINRLTITTGDSMVEAAATQWAIRQLEALEAAELEADLKYRPMDDDPGDLSP